MGKTGIDMQKIFTCCNSICLSTVICKFCCGEIQPDSLTSLLQARLRFA
jgi:hypothetical protein